ncbi:hypothetical protein [Halapricum salinum]|uniref:Domain of unknown function domain-containing protein n=1 Tax=Halapricum salinum TaxID=1457250 RepID=A0A4D6HFD2_9EURY|nr:hypothetical protein [Halapricum salinum]QCC51457.1 hypothetical protein DV733_09490 [Halapricum salinum]
MTLLNATDRPKGVLTTEDRQYLFGDLDMSSYSDPENAVKQRRHRIRRRLEHALLDLVVVNNLLSGRDQAQIFNSIQESTEREQFEHIMSELFDFLYANLPVGHREACASLGLAKAYHRGTLIGTGGNFNIRPTVNIEISDQMSPAEFDHEANIARYHADIERVSEATPNAVEASSETPENEEERQNSADLFRSPMKNHGYDPEEVRHDNRATVYQQRIEFLDVLDKWQV